MARYENLNVRTLRVKDILINDMDGTGDNTLSGTEIKYLDGITIGTVAASKAVVVDANKDAGDFRNLDCTNLDAGASGTAGTVDVFPTTASKGKFGIAAVDNTGDTTVILKNAEHGQQTDIHFPDSGLADAYVLQSTAAVTVAEADILDGATVTTAELNYLDASVEGVGTAATGYTAEEKCFGNIHHTILTASADDAFSSGDNVALATGDLCYTFPAGQILVIGAAFNDLTLTAASSEQQTDTPDVGLGTTIGSGANATLDAVGAAAENILTGQTWSTGTMNGTAQAAIGSLAAPLAIADGGDHTVYINVADTWADDTGADLTCDIAGEIHLTWIHMGNPA